MTTARPDAPVPAPDDLSSAVRRASLAFRSHGGGVELDTVAAGTAAGSRDGGADPGSTVRVRFLGACTGCPCRPGCLTATVEPLLLEVSGVRRVEAEGVRISAEAQARLTAFLAGTG